MTRKLKYYKLVLALLVIIASICSICWFLPFEYKNDGYCGEDSLYRYKFEVYSCDSNSEAAVDFQCFQKVGDFWNYIGLKKLDCELEKK